jgi:hypothetical protein
MSVNPALSLKEQYGPRSQAWQEQQSPPIVRFWCDDGTCWAIPFFQIAFMHYHPDEQSLLIECSPGTIVVTGPKVLDFCDRFCSHKVGLVKADGKDILAIAMALRGNAGMGLDRLS